MKAMVINYVPAGISSIEKKLLAAVAKILKGHDSELASIQFAEAASVQLKEIQVFNFMTGRN